MGMRQYLNKKRTGIIEKFLGYKLADLDLGAGKSTKANISLDINRDFKPNIVADVQCLPIKSESVKSIVCSHIIEHLEDANEAMAEMKRVLMKNGVAVFFLPDDGSVLWRMMKPIWTVYYEKAVSKQDSPRAHINSFNYKSFQEFLRSFFKHIETGKINFGMEIYAVCKCG